MSGPYRRAPAIALVAVLAASLVAGASGRSETRWVIRDLGTLGGLESDAAAINERGQIVGSAATAGGAMHAFLWQGGRMTDLGTLGGKTSRAAAINERGDVIGTSATRSGREHAFVWRDGKMVDLGTLGGKTSWAVDLNDRGDVVGTSATRSGREHAFVWRDGKMVDLGTLPGGTYSWAVDLNDRGQIVGSSDSRIKQKYVASLPDPGHAFLWQAGKMTDLGTLRGRDRNSAATAIDERGRVVAYSWHTEPDPNGEEVFDADFPRTFVWQSGRAIGRVEGYSTPSAMNERGQVVGLTYPSDGLLARDPTWGSFLWWNGTSRDLGQFSPEAINERGQIVGTSEALIGIMEADALLWHGGTLTTLPSLGGRATEDRPALSGAVSINEHDQIVGYSTARTGRSHAVLWTLKP